jgi:hypothetical protein
MSTGLLMIVPDMLIGEGSVTPSKSARERLHLDMTRFHVLCHV